MNKIPHQTMSSTISNLNRRQSDNAVKKGSKDRNISSSKTAKQGISNGYSSSNNNQINYNSNSNYNTNNMTQTQPHATLNSFMNLNPSEPNQPIRKIRANSCVGVMKSNQSKKQGLNSSEIDNEFQPQSRGAAAVELYHFIRGNIDQNILNEFDTFQDTIQEISPSNLNENELLENIKQLIEIHFIQSKAAEKELKEKHEQECDSYDKNLQRLEAQIRDHIRIQQELKLYLESSQIKCQEQEEQISTLEKRHSQQTDFLEKVCEQMQQQLEIKDVSISDMKQQISSLQSEIVMLKESLAQKSIPNIPKNKIQQDFHYYSKQMNNLSNQRSQTENSSSRKIKLATPTHIQTVEVMSQIQTDQSLADDKENNMQGQQYIHVNNRLINQHLTINRINGNQVQVSLYRSQLKQSMRDDVSPEKKIQTIIQQQKLQNSQQKQSYKQQVLVPQFNNEKKNQGEKIPHQEKVVVLKMENLIDVKDKRKESAAYTENYSSIQSQSTAADKQFSTVQAQPYIPSNINNQQIKSNGNIPSLIDSRQYAIADQKISPSQPEPVQSFQEKMVQASKKIKEYIKQQSARDKNSSNNKQQLINKLKYFSMKNSRAPSITNQNNLIQYFYEKFEDKLERNPSERSNIKQKMKTLQQISDRRYSTINHKTEESEGDRRVIESKRSQRHNRSNSFNIGSQQQQQQTNNSNHVQEQKQADIKFVKKQKNYIPIHSTQSSHNNISNSGIASNNFNLNQIGNLNTNSSNISNFMINNSFTNWNKRRESVFNQSGVNNISFQLDGAQKIVMNNNYIDESSDSFENFIKDNFILTNNSTENLKTLEL